MTHRTLSERLLSYLRAHPDEATTSPKAARALKRPVSEVRACYLRARRLGLVELGAEGWRLAR